MHATDGTWEIMTKYVWELTPFHLCVPHPEKHYHLHITIYSWTVRLIQITARLFMGNSERRDAIHGAWNLLALKLISKHPPMKWVAIKLLEPSNTEGPPKLKTKPKTETLRVGWILRDCLIQILSLKLRPGRLSNFSKFTKLVSGWAGIKKSMVMISKRKFFND